MQAILEARDNTKIATTATNRPEEVRVILGINRENFPIGSDNLGGKQVINGHAIFSCEIADATP